MAAIRPLGEPPAPEALLAAGAAPEAGVGGALPTPPLCGFGAALEAGLVVAIPTDTVYGLAADPFRPGATDRIFEAKKRPRDVELPVLVADVEQALSLCAQELVAAGARRLMERFWPGPLTLVLPRRPGLDADLGSDDLTIGVRCPAHVVARTLCARVGPLAVTSA